MYQLYNQFMVYYFSNRRLAKAFHVNLAKWKRWSRTFLPPDPLGGYQSGYARQYSLDDAMNVFLGGHLVAGLKFTLPQAVQVMQDLTPWLEERRFYFNVDPDSGSGAALEKKVREYRIEIRARPGERRQTTRFVYRICGVISCERVPCGDGCPVVERYLERLLPDSGESAGPDGPGGVRILEISRLHRYFCDRLGI